MSGESIVDDGEKSNFGKLNQLVDEVANFTELALKLPVRPLALTTNRTARRLDMFHRRALFRSCDRINEHVDKPRRVVDTSKIRVKVFLITMQQYA